MTTLTKSPVKTKSKTKIHPLDRKIHPLADRVVVRPLEESDVLAVMG